MFYAEAWKWGKLLKEIRSLELSHHEISLCDVEEECFERMTAMQFMERTTCIQKQVARCMHASDALSRRSIIKCLNSHIPEEIELLEKDLEILNESHDIFKKRGVKDL